jgi:hypothetical protein
MSPDDPRKPSVQPSKEERLAKALRENLTRRKALARAKKGRAQAEPGPAQKPQGTEARDDDPGG